MDSTVLLGAAHGPPAVYRRSVRRRRLAARAITLAASFVALACAQAEPLDESVLAGTNKTTGGPTTTSSAATGTGGSVGSSGPGTSTGTAGSFGSGGTTGSGGSTGTAGSSTGSAGSTGSGGTGGSVGSGGSGGSGGSTSSGGSGGGAGMCTAPAWDPMKAYRTGDRVSLNGKEYVANFYTMGDNPETNHESGSGPPSGKPWSAPTTC